MRAFLLIACLVALAAAAKPVYEWTKVTPGGTYTPVGRFMMAEASDVHNGKYAVVFGGAGQGGVFLNDLFMFDLHDFSITLLDNSGDGPSARAGACGIFVKDREFVLFGGYNGTYLNDVWTFDLGTSTWTQSMAADAAPPARAYHTCFESDTRGHTVLSAFGGMDGDQYFSDVVKYDLDTGLWSSSFATGPSARAFISAQITSGHGVAFMGGYDGTNCLGDTWQYDSQKETFSQIPSTTTPLAAYASSEAGNEYHTFGGYTCANSTTDLFEVLVHHGNSPHAEWDPITTTVGDTPAARAGASMSGYPQGSLLYGGADGYVLGGSLDVETVFNDFWKFDKEHTN